MLHREQQRGAVEGVVLERSRCCRQPQDILSAEPDFVWMEISRRENRAACGQSLTGNLSISAGVSPPEKDSLASAKARDVVSTSACLPLAWI